MYSCSTTSSSWDVERRDPDSEILKEETQNLICWWNVERKDPDCSVISGFELKTSLCDTKWRSPIPAKFTTPNINYAAWKWWMHAPKSGAKSRLLKIQFHSHDSWFVPQFSWAITYAPTWAIIYPPCIFWNTNSVWSSTRNTRTQENKETTKVFS